MLPMQGRDTDTLQWHRRCRTGERQGERAWKVCAKDQGAHRDTRDELLNNELAGLRGDGGDVGLLVTHEVEGPGQASEERGLSGLAEGLGESQLGGGSSQAVAGKLLVSGDGLQRTAAGLNT